MSKIQVIILDWNALMGLGNVMVMICGSEGEGGGGEIE